MDGHHLILGETRDIITGKIVADTHDERYRQKLARLLVDSLGYPRDEIAANVELFVKAGDRCAILRIDYAVAPTGRTGMIIKYGPGSLVTRHRPALAASRLIGAYQVPLVVVTNGEDAELLDGVTGKVLSRGLTAIPARGDLVDMTGHVEPVPISEERRGMEGRILYAFEVDDSCPCDDTICRL